MTEDVYRSAAYQTLIALCMTAGDVEDAQRLSLKVKDAAVKDGFWRSTLNWRVSHGRR